MFFIYFESVFTWEDVIWRYEFSTEYFNCARTLQLQGRRCGASKCAAADQSTVTATKVISSFWCGHKRSRAAGQWSGIIMQLLSRFYNAPVFSCLSSQDKRPDLFLLRFGEATNQGVEIYISDDAPVKRCEKHPQRAVAIKIVIKTPYTGVTFTF